MYPYFSDRHESQKLWTKCPTKYRSAKIILNFTSLLSARTYQPLGNGGGGLPTFFPRQQKDTKQVQGDSAFFHAKSRRPEAGFLKLVAKASFTQAFFGYVSRKAVRKNAAHCRKIEIGKFQSFYAAFFDHENNKHSILISLFVFNGKPKEEISAVFINVHLFFQKENKTRPGILVKCTGVNFHV